MTIMGMAASQARFLGLTARKSNVEYQGQQINQQRTALSNESANLYNQMLELTVPTPPSTTDYYKTTYVLEDSQASYASSNYKITNATKTYNAENQYKVTLTTNVEQQRDIPETFKCNTKAVPTTKADGSVYNVFTFNLSAALGSKASGVINVTYDPENVVATRKEGSATALDIANNQIYKAEASYNLDGYATCCTDTSKTYYFYKDKNGSNHFLTAEQLTAMTATDADGKYPSDLTVYTDYANTYTTEHSTEVIATITKSSSGRFSDILINEDPEYDEMLSGRPFKISTTQEMDEEAYNDAYNDYEYEKAKYEKSISDINAQTEIIQNEDQQLELRLQQLNTEQNAISTEMDSVSKVIEDNVDKTFKVFA
ncbi:hypothetical protein IJ531_03780 [bacterium]|nr:hypothetical protein [bacterium]